VTEATGVIRCGRARPYPPGMSAHRTPLGVLLGVLLGAFGLLVACTSATAPPAAGPVRSAGPTGPGVKALGQLQPACPAPPARRGIKDAAAANALVAMTNLARWQAADIGASVRLSDGRIVWVFGDTLRAPALNPRIVANSMLITSGTCVSQLIPADGGPVLPDPADHTDPAGSTALWPMSAVVLRLDADEDELILLCSRIHRGTGAYDFRFVGTSAAVFDVSRLGVPRLRRIDQITPDDSSLTQVNWGAAAVVHDRWLYVYGTRLSGAKAGFGREMYVARVPISDPSRRSGWRFWDGERWRDDVTAAAPILAAAGGVSQTLSVDVVRGAFIAVSKRDGDLGNFVYTWASTGPTGPWRARRAVPAPAGFDTGALQYAPLAHPEVPLDSGRLLVSISRNTTDLAALVKDPQLGRPRFVEIPAPRP
jgi:hypothetical protein